MEISGRHTIKLWNKAYLDGLILGIIYSDSFSLDSALVMADSIILIFS